MNNTKRDVLVAGAGIVGLACGLQLLLRGHRVTILDPNDPASGTSFGNMGIITADSCLPMAAPGIVRQVPGWLMDPLGPLSIRWRHFPRLLPWLVRFLRAGTAERSQSIARTLREFMLPIHEAYAPLLKAAGAEGLIAKGRYIGIYETAEGWHKDEPGIIARRQLGVKLETIPGDQLASIEPGLSRKFYRGLLMPDSRFCVDPHGLALHFARAFTSAGGEIRRERVQQCRVIDDRSARIETDTSRYETDALVVAMGARSHFVAKQIGDFVPLESQRGYHVMLPEPDVRLSNGLSFFERKIVATPMNAGLRLGGAVEFGGLEAPPKWRRADQIKHLGEQLLPGLNTQNASRWMGHRPSLPDSMPVVGPSPHCKAVLYAFGHGHYGLTMAAITADAIGKMVDQEPPSPILRNLSVTRF